MGITEQFEKFASAFELCVDDDNWSRLADYFADDATYLNVGVQESPVTGRDRIVAFLQKDVAENDRNFSTRTLEALTPPLASGDRLSRQWRCTYTLEGAPDLVVEGEARYWFDKLLIKSIEEEITPESMLAYESWMGSYGHRLKP